MVILIHIVGGILLLTGLIGIVLGLRIRDRKSASYGVVWGTSFAAAWLGLFLVGEESDHAVKLLVAALGILYAQYRAWSEFR
jgi:hypothetical protein